MSRVDSRVAGGADTTIAQDQGQQCYRSKSAFHLESLIIGLKTLGLRTLKTSALQAVPSPF